MKKHILFLLASLVSLGAYAYPDYPYTYGSSNSDQMSGFDIFIIVVASVYIILSIIVLVRWWKLTKHVAEIKDSINKRDDILAVLASDGKEEAQRVGIRNLMKDLLSIYNNYDIHNRLKAQEMKPIFSKYSKLFNKLGFNVPDYLRTVSNFITYMNDLTGNDVNPE